MDPQSVRRREAQCIQEQPPFCSAACPIHVDVRGMVERVRKGDFKGALSVYSRYAPFPGILSLVCDRPCEHACKRREAGEALRIGALERACVEHGGAAPARHRAPPNGRTVAVAGGGLSGLTVALELAAKGYEVTVFESSPRLLPRIRELVPEPIVEADLLPISRLPIEVRTSTPAPRPGELAAAFEAVFVGCGVSAGAFPELAAIDPETLATPSRGIFAGGHLRRLSGNYSPIHAVQDGTFAAVSIDRFLQGASLVAARDPIGPRATRLHTRTEDTEPTSAVEPASASYTPEEAVREASRCLPCGCLECVKACEFLAHYKSYPKRYVREIYNNECIVMGGRPANRMINSCTLCGLCAGVCPEGLSMREVCLEARQTMVERGKMPASAHEFALRDMAHATSEACTLARHQPGRQSSAAVFFPGCQLSASSPGHVLSMYRMLCENLPGGVGLMLGCCGAPAHWAGRRQAAEAALREFTDGWSGLGRGRLIVACSSCYRMLTDFRPEIPVEPLWCVLEGIPLAAARPAPARLAIHDPCGTRGDARVQGSVRGLLGKLGVAIEELDPLRQVNCCGYGGLVRFANPEVAEKTVARLIAQSSSDFVTYCAMCRDSFARQGKRALHILDLIGAAGDPDPAARPDPGFSQRRENRARLKTRLLRELWSEPMPDAPPPVRLEISPEVAALLDRRMILLDDVRAVIAHAESTGERLRNQVTGHYAASFRPASVTFWVEYSAAGDGFAVHNAYSHRMRIG